MVYYDKVLVVRALSNFSLYKFADFEIPVTVLAGLRESATNAVNGTSNDETKRLNNKSINTSISGRYSTTVINVSEGTYKIIGIELVGIPKISIDGVEITDLNNVFLSAGTHLFKFENTQASLLQFSALQIIKIDGEYNEDDEASSVALFGDEFTGLTSQIQVNSMWANESFTADGIGEFAETEIFLKSGTYKVMYIYRAQATSSLVDLWVGGVKVLDAFDSEAGSVATLSTQRTVFLTGGKTKIRLEVAGTAGGNIASFSCIRFELLDGKANGDNLRIWGADTDFENVGSTGGFLNPQIGSGDRFNFERRTSGGVGETDKITRYFSGGTYWVKFIVFKHNTGSTMNMGVDDNPTAIFDAYDTFFASNQRNRVAFAMVTIPRGTRDITIELIAGSGTQVRLQQLFFTKIGTSLNAVEDDNSDVGSSTQIFCQENGNVANVSGGTNFFGLSGNGNTATETNHQTIMVENGTISSMSVNIITNPSAQEQRLRLRLNGVDTDLVITIPNSGTGKFESTGNPVSFVKGDLISISSNQSVTGQIVASSFGVEMTS